MIDIIDHHHQYVPKTSSTSSFPLNDGSKDVEVTNYNFHQILFGGDQLTCARARGSQLDRVTSDNNKGQLQGVIPCFEDWHVKVVILKVCPVHEKACMFTELNYLGYMEEAVLLFFIIRACNTLPTTQPNK